MQIVQLFEKTISNPRTNYFVIDSGNYDRDDDYISYAWERARNNKIKTGDVFIYRKTQKLSNNGQFYFYGAGEFSLVKGNNEATGVISNSHPFKKPIFQSELEDFTWKWKERGRTWEHFWNQYGINQITKDDFIGILSILKDESYESQEDEETVKYYAKIAKGDFFVEDEVAFTKVRSWQRAWSDRVKSNYGYMCAMCDVSSPDFLVGSHIIPVSIDKANRMNPSNGICLCSLHDRAFDMGYIGISEEGLVIFSQMLNEDKALKQQLISISKKVIRKPLFDIPDTIFLKKHRLSIFK